MLAPLIHTRLLRYAGLFTWGLLGCWLLSIWLDPAYFQPTSDESIASIYLRMLRWVAVYVTFGVVYWWITRSLGDRHTTAVDHVLLLVLNICAIGVSYYSNTGLGSVLFMVIAGLLPWLMPVRVGIAWLMTGNLAIIPVFIEALDMPPLIGVLQSLLYTGFSTFVFVTAMVAKQQTQARDEQRQLNAELRATRALLAESARINERTRISRELHDLLGHHLTALSLNLEVAGHLSDGRVKEHVQQAHTLARLLLTDVREAVSQLRENGAIDLSLALLPLAENVPALDIRMDIESPITLDDPERAHVLLRCTQEIITNAVRHAGARHLWIDVRRRNDCIAMNARDDGHGADHPVAGNGLRGMRERLQQYGGQLIIDTRPEEGFRLSLTLPVSAASAAAREGAIA